MGSPPEMRETFRWHSNRYYKLNRIQVSISCFHQQEKSLAFSGCAGPVEVRGSTDALHQAEGIHFLVDGCAHPVSVLKISPVEPAALYT